MKIIIFSDNTNTVNSINRILASQGFLTANQRGFGPSSNLQNYDLAIVDISNFKASFRLKESFCTVLKKSALPVLLILNSNQTDYLEHISLKYNDFMFAERLNQEIEARIRFIAVKINTAVPKTNLSLGGLSVNLEKYEFSVNQIPIELTYKEYELLKLFIENKDRVFSRQKLLSMVWGYDFYGGSRTVDVHIRRIRSKLPPPYNLMLKTVRNVGYMFSPDLT